MSHRIKLSNLIGKMVEKPFTDEKSGCCLYVQVMPVDIPYDNGGKVGFTRAMQGTICFSPPDGEAVPDWAPRVVSAPFDDCNGVSIHADRGMLADFSLPGPYTPQDIIKTAQNNLRKSGKELSEDTTRKITELLEESLKAPIKTEADYSAVNATKKLKSKQRTR